MGLRVVIDTGVFISALLSRRGASHRLLLLVGGTRFEIALSVPLVVEYEAAAKRMPEAIRDLVLDDQRLRNNICWSAFDC